MKNVSKIILFILLIFNISVSFAQTIDCETIGFSFNPDAEQMEDAGLKVKLFLEVDKLKNDTIILKTDVKMSLLGPRNIKAYLINKDGSLHPLKSWIEDQINTGQSENIQLLKVLIPDKRRSTIQITYNVLGSTVLKHRPDSEDFYTCQQRHEYYYPMNIPIREIKVSSSDSIKYFVSYKKEKKGIKDINLSFINKKKYTKRPVSKGNLNINLHIPDSLINDKRMEQNVVDMQRYIDKLSTYLSSPKDADIIYINWRDDKERRAFGEAVGDHAVCDINFNSKDLLHELIHILLPSNVEQYSKGEYFMKESIIEWLALFLSDKTINKQLNNSVGSVNLYDTQINNHTTWNLIYIAGPSIIQQIASKCGEEKMADIIISFLQKNQNEIINYNKFIAYMKKHLSPDLVKEMNYLIKTSY